MKEDTEQPSDLVKSATARHRKGNHATPIVQIESNEPSKSANPTTKASAKQSPGLKHEHFPSKDEPPVPEPVDKMLCRFQGQRGKEYHSAQNKRRKLDVSQKKQGLDQDVSHLLQDSSSRIAPRDKRDLSAVTDMSYTDEKRFVDQSDLKLQIGGQNLQQAKSYGSSGRNKVSTAMPYLQSTHMEQTKSKNKTLSIAADFATSRSQFQSNSKAETSTQVTARRRLVDSLGPLEPTVEDAVRASRTNDDTEVDPLPRHSPRRDSSSNSQPQTSSRPVKLVTDSANKGTAETSGPVSSRVGGCKVTYARQRSFLDDTSIVDSRRPSETLASTADSFVQGHRKYGPQILSNHASHLGDGETSDSGPVRGIHELRQAGDNSRFRSAIELIFEDIEDAYNTTSGRCSSFVQICEKLLDRQFVRRFLEHGFHERLVGCIDDRLDVVSASFALCACGLINLCDKLSHISLISHWSNVLVLSPVLLPVKRDLLSLSQSPATGLSRSVQMSIKQVLPRLSSSISGDEPAFELSPQFVALSSIQSCLVSLNNKGGSIEPIPAQMTLLIIIILSLLLGRILCLEEVPLTPLNNYIASQADTWGRSPSYCPTPGDFGRERTASEYSFSSHGERSTPLPQSRPGRLRFLDHVESDDGASDDEYPSYIPYVIEWRVTLNNRVLAKDTEQDLDSAPSSYWQQIKQKAKRVLRQKLNRNRRVKPDDTSIMVSVNDRSQRDLTKRFEKTDIDWTAINRQIRMWQDLLCLPKKKLTVSISINYREDADSSSRKTDKRGNSSVTNRMLRERDDQIDAENYSGQPSVWRDVYQKMRCPGPPCQHEGQYCWQDPIGKKHYRLRTYHLKSIIKYVEQGGILDTHDDVPDNVRKQLYDEEHQRLSKENKPANNLATGSTLPPININVLPTQSSQPVISSSWGTEATSISDQADYPDIPGPLEAVVEEYANWHLSRVNSDSYKENIKKARDIALENCLDLGQIRTENPEFFVKQGVKIGVARRFVSHTKLWLEEREKGPG